MKYKIAAIIGSLRKGSFSSKTAENLIRLTPENIEMEIVEIRSATPLQRRFGYGKPTKRVGGISRSNQNTSWCLSVYPRVQPLCLGCT